MKVHEEVLTSLL